MKKKLLSLLMAAMMMAAEAIPLPQTTPSETEAALWQTLTTRTTEPSTAWSAGQPAVPRIWWHARWQP